LLSIFFLSSSSNSPCLYSPSRTLLSAPDHHAKINTLNNPHLQLCPRRSTTMLLHNIKTSPKRLGHHPVRPFSHWHRHRPSPRRWRWNNPLLLLQPTKRGHLPFNGPLLKHVGKDTKQFALGQRMHGSDLARPFLPSILQPCAQLDRSSECILSLKILQ
jgi:hypothetical protein